MKKLLRYFSPFEWSLWLGSLVAITLSFLIGGDFFIWTLIASLIGVTALIFLAKGNVIGQVLVIIFSTLYAVVSFKQRYFGEMITYLGMSLPSSLVACVSWLKNPSNKGASEVQVAKMTGKKWIFLSVSAVAVTVLFYFILRFFHTNRLLVSTLSVTTSFFASALMIFRSPAYAVAYAFNDIVLIILWTLSCFTSLAYLPMVVCFFAFLCNDSYAFINWRKMQRLQNE